MSSDIASDLRHAVRRLARAPGFTAIALVTLALGIGANTAIFSITQAVLLRPLPYGDPERVVMIWGSRDRGETTWLSASEVLSYGREARGFDAVAAYTTSPATLTGGEEPERVTVGAVTPNIFRALGVAPAAGRAFSPDDVSGGTASDVVILSHALWQRRFGGDPSIVGRSIVVDGSARTVIGVLPARLRLPLELRDARPAELWIPLAAESPRLAGWGNRGLIAIARLADGVTPARASVEMATVEARWMREGYLQNREGLQRAAVPVRDFVVGDVRQPLLVLVGAVAAILLIACANVANLVLARSDERGREVAVRTALGASRGRIVRQLLTESVVLALAGGVLGVLLAWGGLQLLVALHPPGVPRLDQTRLDLRALGAALAIACATGVVFGIAPALELSRSELARTLREGGRTGTGGRAQQRFRDGLAIAQMALSVVLVVGALLLVRSFFRLQQVDLGFDPRGTLTFRVALPSTSYPDADAVNGFYRTLDDRLSKVTGVRSAGATRLLPLTGTIGDWSITIEGRERRPDDNPNGDWQVVTPGYLETMGIRLLRGRSIAPSDDADAPISAVINQTMAERYWPGEDVLGKRFHLGTLDQPWISVVGVVGRVRHNAVVESPRAEMYLPAAQFAAAGGSPRREMTFVLRTDGDPLAAVPLVRQTLKELDPALPLADVRTLESITHEALAEPRFTATLLGLFAALALAMGGIGMYGVIALLVTRRRQEIGIRMALGARRGSILAMVLLRGVALAGTGVAVGVLAAIPLARALASLLYGVSPWDPATFAMVPVLLGAVALAACAVPAARAMSVDPAIAMRE